MISKESWRKESRRQVICIVAFLWKFSFKQCLNEGGGGNANTLIIINCSVLRVDTAIWQCLIYTTQSSVGSYVSYVVSDYFRSFWDDIRHKKMLKFGRTAAIIVPYKTQIFKKWTGALLLVHENIYTVWISKYNCCHINIRFCFHGQSQSDLWQFIVSLHFSAYKLTSLCASWIR